MDDLLRRIGALERLLANVSRLGVIVDADYAKARVRVQVDVDVITGWLPWIAHRAGNDRAWSAPEIGEQVLVLSEGGNLEMGIALPAVYQDKHPAPADSADVQRAVFADGASVTYDRRGHRMVIDLPGGEIVISGNVKITGDVTVTGNISASDEVTAGTVELTQHVHGGVLPGQAETAEPVG